MKRKIGWIIVLLIGALFAFRGLQWLVESPAALIILIIGVLLIVFSIKNLRKPLMDNPQEKKSSVPNSSTQPEKTPLQPEQKIQRFKTYNFNVVGCKYYVDNTKSVIDENFLYQSTKDEMNEDEMVFEYDLEDRNDVQLVPEPDNEHDKNAVRVDISEKTVGYIKSGVCTRVKNLIKSPDFVKYEVNYIRYGNYKELRYDYDKDDYVIDRGRFDYPQISIAIIMKDDSE